MKQYLQIDKWNIVENGFNPEYNRISESIFSIGNGMMGQRANFEERYSGDSLQGSYVAGVYQPDKTKVGWWKNGYPEYFAKVINSPNWIGIDIKIEDEYLDLATSEIKEFRRTLNMKDGYLERSFIAKLKSGKELQVNVKRFCSISNPTIGAIRYSITPLNFSGQVNATAYIDADVINEDANYNEKFWEEEENVAENGLAFITAKTIKLDFHVCVGMQCRIEQHGQIVNYESEIIKKDKYAAFVIPLNLKQGSETVIYKYAAIVSSINHEKNNLTEFCEQELKSAYQKGFSTLLEEQKEAWARKWDQSDIYIEGDDAAQQGIRFNIFQLNQTYTGEDEHLNIGPKGFTGEKYGGTTYWDTEAFCLPFYLSTANENVARNLLIYRYRHLQKAIENATKLGFSEGAALYPMVTMNGEECHNEWEITFEEIHRNGAIAYAIYEYIRYTGDQDYLLDYGVEVLIAISRFWAQRVNFSTGKGKYVMLGVTGPNEYENNVNNNWYTNFIAVWCLKYSQQAIEYFKETDPERYQHLCDNINFDEINERKKWSDIIGNMYFPADEKQGIFLQQDGFLDKEIIKVSDLDPVHLPINQNWSWDRILRSCFLKQADVLQGICSFEEQFDDQTIRRNFEFYEPITVHESSLSPCIHAILASKLGHHEKAYELYLRTSRLDLDDYNNDTEDGCHITSMGGTWMSIVKGFAGMRIRNDQLHFDPFIPKQWDSYSFKIRFRSHIIEIKVTKDNVEIDNHSKKPLEVVISGNKYELSSNKKEVIMV